MIEITNTKILEVGQPPKWATFKGFSVLFDNPGVSLSTTGTDVVRIDCKVASEQDLAFYSALEETLHGLDTARLTREFAFCPLPSFSYHVTVWGGVNDGNISSVSEQHRQAIREFLDTLPSSLNQVPVELSFVERARLLTSGHGPITFRFKKITKWTNNVLVARLKPSDQESESRLESVVSARRDLYQDLSNQLGLGKARTYSPHVTLGYFANQESGALVSPLIDEWTEEFKRNTSSLALTFRSLALYGFTDMASFYKALH